MCVDLVFCFMPLFPQKSSMLLIGFSVWNALDGLAILNGFTLQKVIT